MAVEPDSFERMMYSLPISYDTAVQCVFQPIFEFVMCVWVGKQTRGG